jgi:hypothetical protein
MIIHFYLFIWKIDKIQVIILFKQIVLINSQQTIDILTLKHCHVWHPSFPASVIQTYVISGTSHPDHGMIVSSRIGNAYNGIDSCIFIDPVTGRWTLIFGSFYAGIFQLELNTREG